MVNLISQEEKKLLKILTIFDEKVFISQNVFYAYKNHLVGPLGGAMVWRLPLAQGDPGDLGSNPTSGPKQNKTKHLALEDIHHYDFFKKLLMIFLQV